MYIVNVFVYSTVCLPSIATFLEILVWKIYYRDALIDVWVRATILSRVVLRL